MPFQKADQNALVIRARLLKHTLFALFGEALPRGLECLARQVRQSVLFADREELLVPALAPPVVQLFDKLARLSVQTFIEELRTKYVRDYDAEPLKVIEFPALDAGLSLPRSVPAPRR